MHEMTTCINRPLSVSKQRSRLYCVTCHRFVKKNRFDRFGILPSSGLKSLVRLIFKFLSERESVMEARLCDKLSTRTVMNWPFPTTERGRRLQTLGNDGSDPNRRLPIKCRFEYSICMLRKLRSSYSEKFFF